PTFSSNLDAGDFPFFHPSTDGERMQAETFGHFPRSQQARFFCSHSKDSLPQIRLSVHCGAPWLAQSYNFSSDAKTVTFHLRTDVKWSDGQPFTSADVVFTLEMLKQYPTADGNGLWQYLQDVQAPDSSTVVVTLEKAYTPLLWYLAGQTWIVS